MRSNLYNLVSVVISNGWKGHNTTDQRGEQQTPRSLPTPQPPFPSLSTFSRVLIGPKRRDRKKKKFQGLYASSFMFTRAPCEILSLVNYRLDGGSDSKDQILSHLDRKDDGKCQVWI